MTSVSLLQRLQTPAPDGSAWEEFVGLYTPILHRWLRRDPALGVDADDIVQTVLVVVVAELPRFERRRDGAFRAWLKQIVLNRLRAHWASKRRKVAGADVIETLADPASDLSRQWDADYDQNLFDQLMNRIEPEFPPSHWRAFRRIIFDNLKPAEAAAEGSLTANAVRIAKSRILARLREVGRDLLD